MPLPTVANAPGVLAWGSRPAIIVRCGNLLTRADLSREYRLELVAYEGGQHLVGYQGAENLQPLTDLFIAANRHPRMYDLSRRHLNRWFAEGGGLYVGFLYVAAPSQWGSWGVLEYQDQPAEQARKYRAMLDVLK